MAAEYSKNNIISILTDTIISHSGTYSRDLYSLTLGAESMIEFQKDFNADSEDLIKAESILVDIRCNILEANLSSRYNSNMLFKLSITYFNDTEEVWTTGQTEIFGITPYDTNETDGYVSRVELAIKEHAIKSVNLKIYNKNTDNDMKITYCGIGRSLTVTESLGDSLAIEVTFKGITEAPNGLSIHFSTGDINLKTLKDSSNNFAGFNANNKTVFIWDHTDTPIV